MSCPTCTHTLNGLGSEIWWCPRCGTVIHRDTVSAPALVRRCREFKKFMGGETVLSGPLQRQEWNRLGIDAAINPPESRKV